LGVSLSGQSGDGKTPGTAYFGIISTAQSWTYAYNSGTIYVGQTGNEDLTVGSGGSLSIEAGVTVKLCTTSSDLIITGTGALTANGTSSSIITFTRDYPSINYWGHISFQSMGSASASLFNNCIIEYGDVTRNSNPARYGGGIYTDFNNINISNCIFQNNRAEWGGGIFVSHNISITVNNTKFFNNYSKEAGGGIFVWYQSSSIFNNCIFDSNHCDGTSSGSYTGGGFSEIYGSSVTLNNCTFVNNTSSSPSGQSLQFYSSANDKAINCIFWGAGSHFYLSGTTTVNYCAAQGSAPAGTGNFVLNSSNTASDGPNFSATDGSDWSIKFISPCRDAGTSSGAPATDYLGNGRIGPSGTVDIGAYEVQYSRWNGSTDNLWVTSSNWDSNVDPGSGTGDIIIPSGLSSYPTGDPAQGYVLGSGKYMILKPGAKATFGNLRTTGGTLKLESDASGISSLIVSSITGPATVELYLTGGGAKTTYKWHYISTPVSSLPVSTFAPGTTLDLAQYVESRPTISTREGWVAYDGYIYSTGGTGGPTFSNLTPGKGYNYWDNLDNKFTFSGQLNTADASIALGFSGDATLHGFNLLGNPFSSGLNWDDVINSVYFTYPTSTSKSLYFTRDNVQCSYIGGVGTPGDVTGIIPPMQGFFNKTYSTGNTITLPAAARVQGNIHSRYKGSTVIPLVRLSLAEGKLTDETVVRFDAAAKSDLDYDFDAIKMFLAPDIVSIYSLTTGTKYAINGLPFPDTFVEIPVVVNLTKDTIHTISATQLQGLDNYDVTLTDNTTLFTADLKTTPVVTFSAAAGTIADRFILKIGTIATGTENPVGSKNTFNIYPSNNFINIQTIADEWDGKSGSVKVLDLTGKTVTNQNNSEFRRNSLIQVASPVAKGIYVVEMKSGVMRYVGKVVIK
jgi:hypothetical protein